MLNWVRDQALEMDAIEAAKADPKLADIGKDVIEADDEMLNAVGDLA